ncbi:heavy metal transport/detoxification protein [Corallococcus sp. CAG:1435]|nr:heavy metal transport/detoxification protein [Corallococcus sp. CAG:1435]
MKKVVKMENLDCANCAHKMEEAIKKIEGVRSVNINFMMQKMILDADDDNFDTIVSEAKKACKKIDSACTLMV